MNHNLSFFAVLLGLSYLNPITGQEQTSQVCAYQELPNPTAPSAQAWQRLKTTQVGWGSTDVRYKKEAPATNNIKNITLKAWRGERVQAQFTVSAPNGMENLHFEVGELRNTRNSQLAISEDAIHSGFVRYVMTDELNKDGQGGCGLRPNAAEYDSSLVADPIDHLTRSLPLAPQTTQGVWVRVAVPEATTPGTYQGKIRVSDGECQLSELTLTLEVSNRVLPPAKEWAFHLDLWQNPFAEARVYGVEPWSDEHLNAMRPDMELYAQAGGKSITTSIMHKPWNGQTYDYFESMITWMKRADGTWYYDYTVFDKWVEYMMGLGVNKEITCYSLIPWHLSFQYYDQATNSFKQLQTKPGEPAFEQHWLGMLTNFAAHLKEKGWFDITHISMDERPMEAMQHTLKVIRKADPDFKISMAGDYHPELEADLDNYCVSFRYKLDRDMIQKRKDENKVTTYYTSCTEALPNTFSFSEPAEAEWLGWRAAKENLDGYLRWALNSWVKSPLQDTRFTSWAAGDTYLIYPGARTSVRFERLTAGIQAYEKIRILRDEFTRKRDKASLRKLDKMLERFNEEQLKKESATEAVAKANRILNSF